MRKTFLSLMLVGLMLLLALPGCARQDKESRTEGQAQTAAGDEGAPGDERDNTVKKQLDEALQGQPGNPATNPQDPNGGKMPPSETKINPLPDFTADETVEISGKTRAGNRIFINGKETPVDPRGQFTGTVQLKPGDNTIAVDTLNKKGTPDKQSLSIKYQPLAPKLLALAPESSDSETVTVSGQTEPGCIVYINSSRTQPDKKGNFSLPVKLEPGSNSIKVVSSNSLGGQALVTKNVTFNPPDPKLVLIVPGETSSQQVTISGITDDNTVLLAYVNDVKTNVNNNNGIFSGTVQLKEGLNTITVQVANKWGKTRTQQKNVNYQPVNQDQGGEDFYY
ncbi:NHL repeat domain protein [Desulfocucumis palustris]|uniref:NHL repeat domain protein n=1 Tax=Desulfocucumis palustris TaxID=1898651 RepID=A0A2L2XGN9_9FIRM|nr:hypothetical protein [Desulfocucumis palustris]GBF35300.1 NHL repeat domain protein [Desulfocucumis palustris]